MQDWCKIVRNKLPPNINRYITGFLQDSRVDNFQPVNELFRKHALLTENQFSFREDLTTEDDIL